MVNSNIANLNRVTNKIVYIHGDFDESIMEMVLPALDKRIEKESDKKEGLIIFDICSHGGYASVLNQLLGRIELCKSRGIIVETRVSGVAYSCGSLLACSGTKGYRFIGEYAEHLCHLGATGGMSAENKKELERITKRGENHFNHVISLYKKYAKIPKLEKIIRDDLFFIRGKDIIKFGLADKILC